MAWLQTRQGTLWSAALLALLGLVLLWLLPPEQTLGGIVRVIFLHGALVQIGLVAFAVAGLLGLVYLWRRTAGVYAWLVAVQQVAVLIWIAYALSSMLSTYLAWGQWIAWDEPRVRASAGVLWFAITSLALVWWVGNPIFTALANIVQAGVAWVLIKGAILFRHPFDPIGASGSLTYRITYGGLLLVVLALAFVLARGLHARAASPKSP